MLEGVSSSHTSFATSAFNESFNTQVKNDAQVSPRYPDPSIITHALDQIGSSVEHLVSSIGKDLSFSWPKPPASAAQEKPAKKGLHNERLTYKTIAGGPRTDPWNIRWKLTRKTKAGGWIVQHIQADFKGQGRYNYWEAWRVPPNSQFTKLHLQHFQYDDEFAGPAGSTIHATARFYEGLHLPRAFVRQPSGFPAGILRATKVNPHLPTNHATARDVRTWVA